jgi:RNA recognition motif-containing protein
MTISIGNLFFDAEAEDVRGLFSGYGEVCHCKLPLDRETGRPRGFAFVEMVDAVAEQTAIRVNRAEPRGHRP